MEMLVNGLIILHAASGGVALIAGGVAQAVGKGGKRHIQSGTLFYISMLVSAVSALVVSQLPGHENNFLFSIGIFTVYFVVTGYRATRYKKASTTLVFDKILSWFMAVVGLLMIVLPVVLLDHLHIIMAVFGAMVTFFAIRDLLLFRDRSNTRKSWLTMHIVKIMSAYISAFTAFVVVNSLIPGLWGWFAPGVVGGVAITMWLQKLKKGTIRFAK